jgi:hypothetical protein
VTFARSLLLGTVLWVGAITLLHVSLNWGLFEPAPAGADGREKFKVGFLPVT